MRKLLLSALFIAFLVAPAAADVQYSGSIDQQQVILNTSIQLECDDPCPVSRWGLTWTLPENADIIEIRDSLGEIEDYERSGRSVSIKTNTGEPRRTETVRIRMRIDEEAEEVYDGLHYRNLKLPSLKDEETTGKFVVEDLISGYVQHGFESSFGEEEFRIQGEGPTNIRVNLGQGEEEEFYEFFGDNRDNSSEAYRLAVGTTGIVQQFKRFPVSVMPPRVYNDTRPSWSSGEYVAGNIALRDNLEDDYIPTLAHETVHGLNDRFLKWDQTRSSYLDEGVSEHVEYLMTKKLYRNGEIDQPNAELFGGKVRYDLDPSDRTYHTISPKGDRERLWEYYQSDGDFMRTWNPSKSEEFRDFGYAYSELLIKNYVVNRGTVRDLYEDIGPNRVIESPDEKWNYLSQQMEMEPCNYDSQERFDSCLDDINSHDYRFYSASSIQRGENQLEFDEIELPNRTKTGTENGQDLSSGEVSFRDFLKGFVDYLLSFLK